MPVISPRRSSATSGSFYVTPSSSSASTELSGHGSYLDRGNSLSKASSTSYSSSYGLLNSYSYLPRTTSTYRSTGISSPTTTSSLAGGLSKYSSYRSPSTYLSSNNDSSSSSRYGLKSKSKDPLKKDGNHETSKSSNSGSDSNKSNNRLSSSYSSSSLARLVATSGLDLYEKYSPAHYIPKCEILRSRSSVSEADNNNNNNNNIANDSKETAVVQPKSRYSRFSNRNNIDDVLAADSASRSSSKAYDKLLNSSSSSLKKYQTNENNTTNYSKSPSEDTIPTYTIYSNRLRKSSLRNNTNENGDDENGLKNGSAAESNSIDRITSTRNHLKDLNLSSSSALSGAADRKETFESSPTATATFTLPILSNGSNHNGSNSISTTMTVSKLDTQLANSNSKVIVRNQKQYH